MKPLQILLSVPSKLLMFQIYFNFFWPTIFNVVSIAFFLLQASNDNCMMIHSVYILYSFWNIFLQVWRFASRQMSQVVGVDPIKPFSIRGDKVVASTRKCKNLKLTLKDYFLILGLWSQWAFLSLNTEQSSDRLAQVFETLFAKFSKQF